MLMVGRNINKVDLADAYYHVYARGSNKQLIFHGAKDYTFFFWLLKRHLSPQPVTGPRGVLYEKLGDDIELLSYCLMPNHFHLLFYQKTSGAMTRLMRSVMPSYSRYYNQKYSHSGPLFESRYRASRISNDQYVVHISRYIHLNPKKWDSYTYSSLGSYVSGTSPDWLQTSRILSLFKNRSEYLKFHEDYLENRDDFAAIKHELADK